jgi:hypothetical protein
VRERQRRHTASTASADSSGPVVGLFLRADRSGALAVFKIFSAFASMSIDNGGSLASRPEKPSGASHCSVEVVGKFPASSDTMHQPEKLELRQQARAKVAAVHL